MITSVTAKEKGPRRHSEPFGSPRVDAFDEEVVARFASGGRISGGRVLGWTISDRSSALPTTAGRCFTCVGTAITGRFTAPILGTLGSEQSAVVRANAGIGEAAMPRSRRLHVRAGGGNVSEK
jgi:hypothetical protein